MSRPPHSAWFDLPNNIWHSELCMNNLRGPTVKTSLVCCYRFQQKIWSPWAPETEFKRYFFTQDICRLSRQKRESKSSSVV
jgi:hypothetical protein